MNPNNILGYIKLLYPEISNLFSDEQLFLYIDMCMVVVAIDCPDMTVAQQEYACALLVLATCSKTTEPSTIASKKIKDVEMKFFDSSKNNRWQVLYDQFTGQVAEGVVDDTINYKGI